MTKSYLTHLLTVTVVHVLVLLGTWQLSQSDYARETMVTLHASALKIHIASNIMMDRSVRKKVARPIPKNRDVPVPTPVAEPADAAQPAQAAPTGNPDAVALYKSELRAMIERNKTYPIISKRLGQTGTVVVAFTLLEDGNIIDVKIEKPSRYDNLNSSALNAVKKLERFKPLPKEFGDSKVVFKIPVNFITI